MFNPFFSLAIEDFTASGSFLSSLDMQVGDKIRQSVLTLTISKAMKCVSISIGLFPASTTDGVKRFSELSHCFMHSIHLFCRWFKKYPYRSIHNAIIPYTNQILQYKEVNRNSSVA